MLELIPQYMQPGLIRWIIGGELQGDFLMAYLTNDLFGALGCADSTNFENFTNYAMFLRNYAPMDCYGNHAKVEVWRRAGGYKGIIAGTVRQVAEG